MPPQIGAKVQRAKIEHLRVGDGGRLRLIRLRALANAPDAFGTTLEEATAHSLEFWECQLEQLATFVATVGGCDVGLARGAPHENIGDTGYLLSMWVAPEVRRQGIASILVDAVVNWARSRGLNHLLLDVAEKNAPAVALYTRKGFAPTGAVGTLPPPRAHVREIQMAIRL